MRAEAALALGEYTTADDEARRAESGLRETDAIRWYLLARWVRAEAARAAGNVLEAASALPDVLAAAREHFVRDIELRCLTSIGLLARATGDLDAARSAFLAAVEMLESQRDSLPGEEARTAFVSGKLLPYDALAELDLQLGNTRGAFLYVERARARALLDLLRIGGVHAFGPEANDKEAQHRIDELRTELNWCYSQLHERNSPSRNNREELQSRTRDREQELRQMLLQAQHTSSAPAGDMSRFDLERLQAMLGPDTAMLVYCAVGDMLAAYVVTADAVYPPRTLVRLDVVEQQIDQLRLQMDTLRHGAASLAVHMPQLLRRAQQHLSALYRALLEPLLPLLENKPRLAIVPHKRLHYVPFGAMFDGRRYLIDEREICIAPSASVLEHCLLRPTTQWKSALLFGVPDERAPRVRDEVTTLSGLFPAHVLKLGAEANTKALHELAPAADVVHLACHGVFRQDNPFFSALRLGDGWMLVRDAYALRLKCGLVTLSACETGVSALAPGDELIGLARGFIAAGTPSLLVSLWRVDDDATLVLMSDFYRALLASGKPAQALRAAQVALRETYPHPFYWSAFSLIGRW